MRLPARLVVRLPDGRFRWIPRAIPEAILTGEVDHAQPYPGDRGYRFEPRYPDEWAAAEKAK